MNLTGIGYWLPVWAGKTFPRIKEFLLKRRRNAFTLCYHTHDSRKSQGGFPDLVMIHPGRGEMILAELKLQGSYPTIEQRLWLAAAQCVSDNTPFVNVYLWTPNHWRSIIQALGGRDHLVLS